MNIKQISQLLYSPEPEFKDVGLQQLFAGLPDTCYLALDYLARCEDDPADIVSENLLRRFAFLRPGFEPPRNDGTRPFSLFKSLFLEMGIFLKSLQDVMKGLEAPRRNDFAGRLSHFLGVSGEIHLMMHALWSDEHVRHFNAMLGQAQLKRFHRQLMIFVSYACNLNCPYCFALGMKEPDLSFEGALTIIDWAQKNGVETITFCGGEPTIYPGFPRLLDEIHKRKLRTYFATNLLARPGVLERLHHPEVETLIVHVAHRDTYKGNQWTLFLENMERVLQQGIPIAARINIYAERHDWTHLFYLLERFSLKEVQLALTFPNAKGDNLFCGADEFRLLIPSVINFINLFTQTGIRLVFSKAIPPCLFPESMRDHLLRRMEYSPMCMLFMDGYAHNACISPDGNVSPCLALLDISRPLAEFQNWDDLSSFCRAEALPLLTKPLLPQCAANCFLYERRLCQGACLGHKRFAKGKGEHSVH